MLLRTVYWLGIPTWAPPPICSWSPGTVQSQQPGSFGPESPNSSKMKYVHRPAGTMGSQDFTINDWTSLHKLIFMGRTVNIHPVMTFGTYGNLVEGSDCSSKYEDVYLFCISMPHSTQEWGCLSVGTSACSHFLSTDLNRAWHSADTQYLWREREEWI